jgi:hypothetical protein
MRIPALIIAVLWAAWAVGEMDYQDEIRQERAHCEAGLELGYEMPRYCDKYDKSINGQEIAKWTM